MEPSNNSVPNFELPAPQNPEGNGEAKQAPEKAPAPVTPEAMPGRTDMPGSASPTSSPLAPHAPAIPALPATPPVLTPATTQPIGSATPMAASDGDLIEKEWVEKAKEIVEKTRSDPRKQNVEINNFKADYMKKRYNKDIKVMNE